MMMRQSRTGFFLDPIPAPKGKPPTGQSGVKRDFDEQRVSFPLIQPSVRAFRV